LVRKQVSELERRQERWNKLSSSHKLDNVKYWKQTLIIACDGEVADSDRLSESSKQLLENLKAVEVNRKNLCEIERISSELWFKSVYENWSMPQKIALSNINKIFVPKMPPWRYGLVDEAEIELAILKNAMHVVECELEKWKANDLKFKRSLEASAILEDVEKQIAEWRKYNLEIESENKAAAAFILQPDEDGFLAVDQKGEMSITKENIIQVFERLAKEIFDEKKKWHRWKYED